MGEKILVAFDDSTNAMRAVEHVAKYFKPTSQVTLFNVLPDTATICDMTSPELTSYFKSQQSNFCLLEEKKKALVDEAMQKAKKLLVDVGFDEMNISLKTQVKKSGIARDIVNEARMGYDIIVLGRRGLSGVKEFFLGSVSQKVLNSAKEVSILMVN
jgi:nucleotide-binding universal stress UspA family protein